MLPTRSEIETLSREQLVETLVRAVEIMDKQNTLTVALKNQNRRLEKQCRTLMHQLESNTRLMVETKEGLARRSRPQPRTSSAPAKPENLAMPVASRLCEGIRTLAEGIVFTTVLAQSLPYLVSVAGALGICFFLRWVPTQTK